MLLACVFNPLACESRPAVLEYESALTMSNASIVFRKMELVDSSSILHPEIIFWVNQAVAKDYFLLIESDTRFDSVFPSVNTYSFTKG